MSNRVSLRAAFTLALTLLPPLFAHLDNSGELAGTPIGSELNMAYTLPRFMGYRIALFNYATKTAGGFVEFDYFRASDKMAGVN
jgi:hypothetical protein